MPLNACAMLAKDTVLGSGEFGTVHPGFFNGEAVAVKTFKSTVDIDEFKGILAEIKIMGYLGNHENVVKFVGADISRIDERKEAIQKTFRLLFVGSMDFSSGCRESTGGDGAEPLRRFAQVPEKDS